jgi:phage baseplate assembly protein W
MAVVLGSKKVQDLEQFNDTAIGITLPLQITNTAFNQSFQTIDQVRTNIKSLLLTKRRERVMQPFLGSGLTELLFEQNDEELESRIENTILQSLQNWLPYVVIDTIIIEQSNELKDRNSVEVSITFRINGNPTLETVTFNVEE